MIWSKPFSPGELVARVKAHIRRYTLLSCPIKADEWLKFNQLEIDCKGYRVFEGTQVATALIDVNPSIPPFNVFTEVLKRIILSFVWGFFTLMFLIILFTWYLSQTILKPIQELSLATQKISEDNLEFSLHYQKKDEFGKFIKSFDHMRNQLKESLAKQKAYEQSRKTLIASISHFLLK